MKTKRKLTEEQEIILDCWLEYAPSNKTGRYACGISVLEGLESYLRKNNIINSWGNKRPEIIW